MLPWPVARRIVGPKVRARPGVSKKAPTWAELVHEIKYDRYRLIVRKDVKQGRWQGNLCWPFLVHRSPWLLGKAVSLNGALMNTSIFSFWAKTGRSDSEVGAVEFHPLIYHLLDVAACAETLLRQERRRVDRLAKACSVDADDLSRCFVALIALHDIGKCARGFQGKVVELWPEFLGPKPINELNVRHDAAGIWLFAKQSGKLEGIAQTLLPNLSQHSRMKIIQALCGHHGEPINWHDYPDIGNCRRQIGPKAQEAAEAIADAIITLFQPPACPLEDRHAPLASFWLAGLTVLSDWLGSNRGGRQTGIVERLWRNGMFFAISSLGMRRLTSYFPFSTRLM